MAEATVMILCNWMVGKIPFFPYAAFILTAAYVFFCLLIWFLLPQCATEDAECGYEGVDNSVLGWSSDFFVAGTIGLLSIHLYWNTSKKVIGAIAFTALFLGYLLKGFAARYFGNSGTDGDGKEFRSILSSPAFNTYSGPSRRCRSDF
jgi:hypothetical protein